MTILGNRYVQIALLVVGLIVAYGAWSYHMQKVGADKFQVEQQAKQIIADKKQAAKTEQALVTREAKLGTLQATIGRLNREAQTNAQIREWDVLPAPGANFDRLRELATGQASNTGPSAHSGSP